MQDVLRHQLLYDITRGTHWASSSKDREGSRRWMFPDSSIVLLMFSSCFKHTGSMDDSKLTCVTDQPKKSIKFRRPHQTFPSIIHCPSPWRNFCSLHIWKASSKWFIHSTILSKCSLRARHWGGNWKGSDGALALDWLLTTELGHPRSPFQCSLFIMILPQRHFRTSQKELRDVTGQTPSPQLLGWLQGRPTGLLNCSCLKSPGWF